MVIICLVMIKLSLLPGVAIELLLDQLKSLQISSISIKNES